MADKQRLRFLDAFGVIVMEPRGIPKTLPARKKKLHEILVLAGTQMTRTHLHAVIDGAANLTEAEAQYLGDFIDGVMTDLTVFAMAEERKMLNDLNPFVLTQSRIGRLRCLMNEADENAASNGESPRVKFFQAWCRIQYPLATRKEPIDWNALLLKFGDAVNVPSQQIRLMVYGAAPMDPVRLAKLIGIVRERTRGNLPPEINADAFR